MAWTATLTNATLDGNTITLYVHIDDGTNNMDVVLNFDASDPLVNFERIKAGISHCAQALGKWPLIQSKIGTVIHSGA